MNLGKNEKNSPNKILSTKDKKAHPNEKKVIDQIVRKIISAPEKGDLLGVYTVKFNLHGAQFRLMYTYNEHSITLLRFGPREGFYN